MRPKMDRRQRAKQFMPFAALTGLDTELQKQEKQKVKRIDLSPEAMEEVDRTLRDLQPRDVITVTYFHRDEYLTLTGMLAGIDLTARQLQVVNIKVPIADIYRIERL